jgi:hypothetical protein
LEKERNFALADKVKIGDIDKLSKQHLYIPFMIMDMVWMTQNFWSVISLSFGKNSLSASFLKEWADHMYENRLIYTSLHAADPSFFAKVLFVIDNALQIHWRSCSNSEDPLSVNNRVLLSSDPPQDSILCHNFIQQILKSINDKITASLDLSKDGKLQKGGKFHMRQVAGGDQKVQASQRFYQ